MVTAGREGSVGSIGLVAVMYHGPRSTVHGARLLQVSVEDTPLTVRPRGRAVYGRRTPKEFPYHFLREFFASPKDAAATRALSDLQPHDAARGERTMANRIIYLLAVAALLELPDAAGAQDDPAATPHPAVEKVLRDFSAGTPLDLEVRLRRQRLPPPSAAVRQRALALLPDQGAVTPDARQARKLAALQPVLALHERDTDLMVRMFTAGGAAWTGLHARSVLLLSRAAVDLLDVEELQAVVAHELGHDLLWREYEDAQRQGDTRRHQELELHCDGLAVLTLHRLDIAWQALVTAVQKLARHNAAEPGGVDETRYVPLGERIRFIRRLAAQLPPPADTLSTRRAPGSRRP